LKKQIALLEAEGILRRLVGKRRSVLKRRLKVADRGELPSGLGSAQAEQEAQQYHAAVSHR